MEQKISFDDLVLFVREEIGEFKIEINESSLIEDDLGVTGADAESLIKNYGQKFNVNIENFRFDKYFYSESGWFIWSKKSKCPLTIGDLYRGIGNKVLDDSIIQSQQK